MKRDDMSMRHFATKGEMRRAQRALDRLDENYDEWERESNYRAQGKNSRTRQQERDNKHCEW